MNIPSLNEFKPGVIQPGMEQLIEAGDTLEITDDQGQKFAVTAIEGTAVMDFCKAFDVWHSMQRAKIQGPVVETAFNNLLNAFSRLPLRVQRELPSWKTLGMNV
jgi:hypothetical protein